MEYINVEIQNSETTERASFLHHEHVDVMLVTSQLFIANITKETNMYQGSKFQMILLVLGGTYWFVSRLLRGLLAIKWNA